MKKILLAAFICIMAFTASAQLASPISIGVHGGWSSTMIDIKNPSVDNIKTSAEGGYMLGVFGRLNLGKLYIQPELNYVRRKGSVELPVEVGAQTAKLVSDLTYSSIDIPILLGYKIIKLPMFNIHVFAGPVASFSTSALKFDVKSLTSGDKDSIEDSINADIDPNKAIWNIKMGGGIEFWKINLDVDYEMGLKDFSKHIEAPKVFNITLGLRLI